MKKKITDSLTRLSVMHLDFYGSLDDRVLLKEIFKLFFKEGDLLFFSFRREENLTDDDELLELRRKVPNEFIKNGEYFFLRRLDEERFDSIGFIECTNQTSSFLLDVWRYFYAFTVFTPVERVSWNEYVSYVEKNGLEDIDGKRLLNDGLTKFVVIKGLGGDYLNITYANGFKLPDLDSLL